MHVVNGHLPMNHAEYVIADIHVFFPGTFCTNDTFHDMFWNKSVSRYVSRYVCLNISEHFTFIGLLFCKAGPSTAGPQFHFAPTFNSRPQPTNLFTICQAQQGKCTTASSGHDIGFTPLRILLKNDIFLIFKGF